MILLDSPRSLSRKARRSLRDRLHGRRHSLIRFSPRVDLLEERTLLSDMTYTVTSNADAVSGGTLRQAIILANANPGNNTIAFALTANATISLTLGPLVIDPATMGDGLNINSGAGPVTIDATGNGPNANNVDEFGASAPGTSTGQIFVIGRGACRSRAPGRSSRFRTPRRTAPTDLRQAMAAPCSTTAPVCWISPMSRSKATSPTPTAAHSTATAVQYT